MFYDVFLGVRCNWFLNECVFFGVWRDGGGGHASRRLGDEGPDGVKAGEGFSNPVGFFEYKVAFIGGYAGFG